MEVIIKKATEKKEEAKKEDKNKYEEFLKKLIFPSVTITIITIIYFLCGSIQINF